MLTHLKSSYGKTAQVSIFNFIASKFFLISVTYELIETFPLHFCQIFKENSTYVFRFAIATAYENSQIVTLFGFFLIRLAFAQAIHGSFYRFISDAPVCGSTQEELLGALKHETLTLKCEVDASPSADSFHWTFNSSGEPTDLPARLHSSEV